MKGEDEPPFSDCIVSLQKSYRFGEHSSIGKLSRAVKNGDLAEFKSVIDDSSADPQCVWRKLPDSQSLPAALKTLVRNYFASLCRSTDPQQALADLQKFRILCAVRKGPFGVETLNNTVIKLLASVDANKTNFHFLQVARL